MFVNAAFSDIGAFCEAMQTWQVEIDLLSKRSLTKPAATVIQAGEVDCEYLYCEYSSSLKVHGDPPSKLVTFNVLEPFGQKSWWRGQDIGAEHIFVFSVGDEFEIITPREFKVHTLSLSEEALGIIAQESEIDLPPPKRRPEVCTPPGDFMRRFRSQLRFLKSHAPRLSFTHVHELVRRVLPHWLGNGFQGAQPRIKARDLAVRRSLELIEGSDLALLTPRQMLETCGVSERTLQYAFQERFGTSPASFLKAQRLSKVRTKLRQGEPRQTSVGDVAAELGFWHLGQFSADYKAAYGERPSETLKR